MLEVPSIPVTLGMPRQSDIGRILANPRVPSVAERPDH